MDIVEKEELAHSLGEIKELVDEILPMESSVVRDQILTALMVTTIQEKLMARRIPPPTAAFNQMAGPLRSIAEMGQRQEAAMLTQAASRMVREEDKLSSEAAQGWALETYRYFLSML
jgi:hypothetical protein